METFVESVNLLKKYNLDTLQAPVIVFFKITGSCNLQCNFCSQEGSHKINMDINKAKRLLKECQKIGVISINYTGGEPLLYPNIEELLSYGYSLGLEQTLVTNGTRLYENINVLKYIHTIGVSLHGKEQTHDKLTQKKGSFKIVEKNIDRIQKEYPSIQININYTISDYNNTKEDLEFIKQFCQKRNIKLCFGRLNYIGFSKSKEIINPNNYLEKIDKIREEYSNLSISNCIIPCACDEKYKKYAHACGAGISIVSIEPNGDVKICPSSNYVIGNAFQTSLQKTLKSSILKKYKRLKWLPNKCRICKSFEQCKGGCHAEGNQMFYQNTCDALLLKEYESVWTKIQDKKLILKVAKIRKEREKYILIKVPLRKIDKIGYEILKTVDGTNTAEQIEKRFLKIKNIRDYLCTLYMDSIIGVDNEEKEN